MDKNAVEKVLSKNRKEHTKRTVIKILSFFIMLVTSYNMILPSSTLTRSSAKGLLFFAQEEENTEAENIREEAVMEETVTEEPTETDQMQEEDIPAENEFPEEYGEPDQTEAEESAAQDEETVQSVLEDPGTEKTAVIMSERDLYFEETTDDEDETERVTVCVDAPSGSFPEGTVMRVKKVSLDREAEKAVEESVQNSISDDMHQEEAVALDISFWYGDIEIEPEKPVTVRIRSAMIREADGTLVVHVDDENNAEALEQKETADDDIVFDTDGFSIFVIVRTTIEKTVITNDGETYRIFAAYSPETGIPADAVLAAEEILSTSQLYEAYVSKAETALGMEKGSTGYIRLFDIKIIDKDDPDLKYQPAAGTSVDVRIELADTGSEDLSIVHFADANTDGDVVDSTTEASDDAHAVSFEADGFSVYAVVDDEIVVPESRMTLYFHDVDDNIICTVYVKNSDTADELTDIIFDPGDGNQDENELFTGWIIGEVNSETKPVYSSADAENAQTVEEIRSWAEARTITDGDFVHIYPMIFKTFSVSFKDEDGVTMKGEALIFASTEDSVSYVINTPYTPKSQDAQFQGWYYTSPNKTTENPTVVADNGSQEPFQNGTAVQISDNIVFTPTIPEGYWLSFSENGKGVSYTPPQFIPAPPENSTFTEKPADPTRRGYRFAGWNTKADGTGDVWLTVTYNNAGTPSYSNSRFGGKLTGRTELFAQWTPVATAPYTIVIWQQQASGDGYDFVQSIQITDTVGKAINDSVIVKRNTNTSDIRDDYARIYRTNTQYTDYRYTGFHFDHYDTGKTVVPEGTTVVNVYFDRNEYTFTFVDNQNPGRTYTEGTGTNANYGYVNGEYVQLTYQNGAWYYPTGEYTEEYVQTTNNNGTQYGIVNGEYTELSYFGNYWHYTAGYSNNGASAFTGVAGTTYYRRTTWFGNEEQIYYRNGAWRTSNSNSGSVYTGNIYARYTGNRYIIQTVPVMVPYEGTRYVRGSQSTTIHTVTARYGSDISSIWNFTGTNNNTYPQTNPVTSWQPSGSSTYTARITTMQIMPAEDITFTHTTTSHRARQFYYYVEALAGETGTRTYNGKQYSLYLDLPNDFNIVFYNDDFFELDGFTRQAITDSNNMSVTISTTGSRWPDVSNNSYPAISLSYGAAANTLYFYYTRDKYPITYWDGKYFNGDGVALDEMNQGLLNTSEDIYYGASLADQENAYIPTAAGYEFAGWYLDDACSGESFDFAANTMPKGGIKLYAKWVQKQYRVFLHPNVPTDDTSLVWAQSNQSTCFRVDLNEKIAGGETIKGERADYELIGWYTDPECRHPFNFAAYTLNDTTVPDLYDTTDDGIYNPVIETELDKYGNVEPGQEGVNKDAEANRVWITRKLDLYAKWRAKLDGANGIYVQYDAVSGKGHFDSDGETITTRMDPLLYLDNADAVVGAASVADAEDEQFLYWVVQHWNGSEYVDTEVKVYPGDTFAVLKSDAKLEAITDGTQTEDVYNRYTVQLKAVYGPKEAAKDTHIDWYPNYGDNYAVHQDKELQINEPVSIWEKQTRPGYKFLGWARIETTRSNSHEVEGQEMPQGDVLDLTEDDLFLTWHDDDGGYYTAVINGAPKRVSRVAADEVTPYHDMYAVWVKAYAVTVRKIVVGTEADKNTEFSFSPVKKSGLVIISSPDYDFTLKHDEETVVFDDLVNNDHFSVTEEANDDFVITVEGVYTDDDGNEHEIPGLLNGTDITIQGDTVITVTNTRKRKVVRILKVDDADTPAPLEGVGFRLGDMDLTTGEDGRTDLVELDVSDEPYILEETLPLDSYEGLGSTVEVTVTAEGISIPEDTEDVEVIGPDNAGVYTLMVTNRLKTIKLKVVKEDQSGNALAGAVFSGDLIEGSVTTQITGTGDEAEAVIISEDEVPLGTYTLTEDSAPAGYNLLSGNVTVEVRCDSQTGQIIVVAGIDGQESAFVSARLADVNDPAKGWIVTVRNDAGVVLPNAGGPGTLRLRMIGILMLVLSGTGMILKKKFCIKVSRQT